MIKKEKNTSGKATSEENQKQEKVRQSISTLWLESQHKDLLFYLAVAIFFLELIVGGVAFFYGLIHAVPDPQGGPPRFQFPWLAYVLAAVLAPAVLLLIVHLAGVGLFHSLRRSEEEDEAWRRQLPERLRKVYAIIQGAPTVVLLVGLLLLGAALVYIDGAVSAVFRLGGALEPYLPWIIGGIVATFCIGYVARIWLVYRSKRLEQEYAFRRDVLERTGIIIVDRGSMQLPPLEAGMEALPGAAVDRGDTGTLPPGTVPAGEGEILDVTPEEGEASNGQSR